MLEFFFLDFSICISCFCSIFFVFTLKCPTPILLNLLSQEKKIQKRSWLTQHQNEKKNSEKNEYKSTLLAMVCPDSFFFAEKKFECLPHSILVKNKISDQRRFSKPAAHLNSTAARSLPSTSSSTYC